MAEQAKKLGIPMWAIIVVSIIITILFMKFCTNNNPPAKVDVRPIEQLHAEDSIRMANEARAYKRERDSFARSLAELKQKQETTYNSLTSVIAQNKQLIKNRIKTDFDSSLKGATVVPQEFIDDCEGCFTQLAKTNDSAIAYQQEANALRAVLEAQNQADSQRIAQLEADKLKLNKSYNDMRIAAEVNAKHLEPRRKVKTGLIGTFGNSFLPTGVGVGLMYEDKKDRNFGLEATFGNRPPAYEAFMYVPFTLRNK